MWSDLARTDLLREATLLKRSQAPLWPSFPTAHDDDTDSTTTTSSSDSSDSSSSGCSGIAAWSSALTSGSRRRRPSPPKSSPVGDFGTTSPAPPTHAPSPLPLRSGLTHLEVEPWQRFPHLLTGYRAHGTHAQCIASMFSTRLHNESLNAWTMVLSLLAALLLLPACLPQVDASNWADASPFWVLFLAQLVHCPVSVGYHTFMPISAATAHRWRRTDLCLVLLLNAASTYSVAYFTVRWYTTLALTTAACACAGSGMYSILSLKQGQSLDRVKMVSQVAGTALGYYGVVVYRGLAAAAAAWSGGAAAGAAPGAALWACLSCPELATVAAMLLCHGIGATCYICHWPQRQFPKVFDLCGFSHNIMHVFCFAIYVWAYPYLSILHSKQDMWFAPT